MPSNRSKYSEEIITQTATYILESGKSATSVIEELRYKIKQLEKQLKEKI